MTKNETGDQIFFRTQSSRTFSRNLIASLRFLVNRRSVLIQCYLARLSKDSRFFVLQMKLTRSFALGSMPFHFWKCMPVQANARHNFYGSKHEIPLLKVGPFEQTKKK